MMTRSIISPAVSEAAVSLGYCFATGFDYRMQESIVAYPALLLSPPKIVAVEGRNEGLVRYRIEMHLMKMCRPKGKESKERIWEQLEEDALEIYRAMARNPEIASAGGVQCAPAEFSLTNHGEISMGLKMDVEIPFCKI